MNTPVSLTLNILDIDYSNDKPKLVNTGKIIFLGRNVPDKIKKAISSKNTKVLKDYYGTRYNHILKLEKKGGDDVFDDLSIEELLYKTPVATDDVYDKIEITKTRKDIEYDYDIEFYNTDDIKTIKNKFFLATDIQYFKQHVFYKSTNGDYNSTLGYNIFIDQNNYEVSLESLDPSNENNKLLGVPIDRYLYSTYESSIIKYLEHTTDLNDIISSNGYGEFYIISIDSFIKRGQINTYIENAIKTDKEQYNIIYWSFVYKYFPAITDTVFFDYVTDEASISYKYPDLYLDKLKLMNVYEREYELLDKVYSVNSSIIKKHLELIKIKIGKVTIKTAKIHFDDVLNTQSLFDLIELSKIPNINFIQTRININFKSVVVTKEKSFGSVLYDNKLSLVNELFLSIFIVNSKYGISLESRMFIELIIDKSSTITIYVQIPSNVIVDKNELEDVLITSINPIIHYLNSLSDAFNSVYRIPLLNNNITYSDVSVNIIYNKQISQKGLLELFDQLIEANIFANKTNIKNLNEYIILKGIKSYATHLINSRYYDLQNNYSFLSDKIAKSMWYHLYSTKSIIVYYNAMGVTFSINYITMEEINYVTDLLTRLFIAYDKSLVLKKTESYSITNINALRFTDPKLFRFKNDSNTGYSRVCQKKFQPLVTTPGEIKMNNIKNAVKYWNFTKERDEYYYCPYSDNKYVGFITGIHPDKYCLPCCKKINKKDEKYKTCIKDKTFSDKKLLSDISIRYSPQYSKDIELKDRITELPNTLLKIVNNSKTDHYYIYGLIDNINNLQNIDVLLIFAEILNLSFLDFIFIVVEYLSKNAGLFQFLLNGTISKFYKNMKELVQTITRCLTINKIIKEDNDINWNDLFIDIMFYYGLSSIIFEDVSDHIELVLSEYNYNSNKILNNDTFILIFRKKSNDGNYKYYPIYNINKRLYFSESIINRKYIQSDVVGFDMLKRIISSYFSNIYSSHNKLLTLNNLILFIKGQNQYTLKTIYINDNKSYAAHLIYKNSDIVTTLELSDVDLDVINEYDISNKSIKIDSMNINTKYVYSFINDYNLFIYDMNKNELGDTTFNNILSTYASFNIVSNKTMDNIGFVIDSLNVPYDFLYIEKFIIIDNKIIGFQSGNINMYLSKLMTIKESIELLKENIVNIKSIILKKDKTSIKNLVTRIFCLNNEILNKSIVSYIIDEKYRELINPYYIYYRQLLYHPIHIHKQLLESRNNDYISTHKLNIYNKAIYDQYIYILFVKLFNMASRSHQNISIRLNIIKFCSELNKDRISILLNGIDNKDNGKIYTIILNDLKKSYKIKEVLLNNIAYKSYKQVLLLFNSSKSMIKDNMKEYKNIVKSLIMNNSFLFDFVITEEMKYMNQHNIINSIEKLVKKHINIVKSIDVKSTHIDINKLDVFYTNKKLNMTQSKYNELVNILAYDISNPFKQKYILSNITSDPSFMNKVASFKQHINERIFINNL